MRLSQHYRASILHESEKGVSRRMSRAGSRSSSISSALTENSRKESFAARGKERISRGLTTRELSKGLAKD